MVYQHQFSDETLFDYPLGKVVCVGRNYAEHAKELNNPIPASPILFIKPATAVTPFAESIALPQNQGSCHYETELAILIGNKLTNATTEQAEDAIAGYGLALDLTLRDVQSQLKEKGHPWELAKSFDGSCPLSPFVRPEALNTSSDIEFQLSIDGVLRQHGKTSDMITAITPLIVYISKHFTLMPGDVVLTGTPAGVGPLVSGLKLQANIGSVLQVETTVN